MKKNDQSNRLTKQQKSIEGVNGIFEKNAKEIDANVNKVSVKVFEILKQKFPYLNFRYRNSLTKKEINEVLNSYDNSLGKTLFLENANIKPDGGIIEVLDDNKKWRIILVSEAKYQGKDIENIKNGILVGKNNNQELMAAGNAIERAYKNICEIANYMLGEDYFPYVLFLSGSNFLVKDIEIIRPNGEKFVMKYNNGTLNRLDRLTAANYGMPIN